MRLSGRRFDLTYLLIVSLCLVMFSKDLGNEWSNAGLGRALGISLISLSEIEINAISVV